MSKNKYSNLLTKIKITFLVLVFFPSIRFVMFLVSYKSDLFFWTGIILFILLIYIYTYLTIYFINKNLKNEKDSN